LHPILFRIGSYEVPAYGVALTIAFAVGIAIARRRARAVGIDEERVIDACLIALATSLVGARLLWVVTHLEVFRGPGGGWLQAMNPFGGGRGGYTGLSMMGGVVLATVSSLAYLAWRGLPLLRTADLLAPSVLLGEGITRIGCFLNGCCYGHACTAWYCLPFPAGSGAHDAFGGEPVLPTQLLASALGIAGFFALSALWRARLRPGAVFFAFLAWVGATRDDALLPFSVQQRATLRGDFVDPVSRLIDAAQWQALARSSRTEVVIAAIAAFFVVTVGVLVAIVVAVVLSIVDVVRRVAAPDDAVLGWSERDKRYTDVKSDPDATITPGVVVYRFNGRLFFANAHFFKRRVWAAVDGAPKPVRCLVLDATALSGIDASSVDALAEVHAGCQTRNITLDIAHATSDLRVRLDETGLTELFGSDNFYPTVPAAVENAREG